MTIKWCQNCILPNSRPNIIINKNGICNACEFSLNKKKIKAFKIQGKKKFKSLFEKIKNKDNYDCLIPVSGGKDSTWQVIKCLENNLTPLAITWKCPSRTDLGKRNLDNLISLGVDHFDITINPIIEKKFIFKTFSKLGSPAIPMHLAIFNLARKIATNFKIPIIVWAENTAKEYGYKKKSDLKKNFLDKNWVKNYGVTNETLAEDWLDNEIGLKNIILYSDKINSKFQTNSIFLADYFPWDPNTTYNISTKKGFKNAKSAKTGLYDFADIDDNFISIHHFMKWYKFGFTRLFDNLSVEIRNKRISRLDAIKYIRKKGIIFPEKDIKIFCEYLGISRKNFFIICEKFRNKNIWEFNKKTKKWFIPNFIVQKFQW